ncbi:MAG: peroxidase family protein [Nitratireductor sp.]
MTRSQGRQAGRTPQAAGKLASRLVSAIKRGNVGAVGESRSDSVTPAGYALLARMIHNDASWDSTGAPGSPQKSMLQSSLDLSSIYGSKTGIDAALSDESGLRFRIGRTEISGGAGHSARHLPHDLPRDSGGRAAIADQRNDANLLFSQFQLIWMKLHNVIADRLAALECSDPVDLARQITVWHFRQIVLRDFLPRIATAASSDTKAASVTPSKLEWAMAMQCIWPGMRRDSYEINLNFDGKPVEISQIEALSGTGGIYPVPSNWIIDWRRFFSFRNTLGDSAHLAHYNRTPKLRLESFAGLQPQLSCDLLTASLSEMEAASAICDRFAIAPMSSHKLRAALPVDLAAQMDDEGLVANCPLWIYLLAEAASQQNGNRLGTLGASIVRNGILAMLPGTDAAAIPFPRLPSDSVTFSLPLTNGTAAKSMAELIAMIDITTPLIAPLEDPRYGN